MVERRNAKIHDSGEEDSGPSLLLEEAPDAFIVVGTSTGKILLTNSLADELFGYESGELPGQPIDRLVPENLRTNHQQHREQYAASGPKRRPMGRGLDLVALRKDGSEFPADVSMSPMVWRDDAVVLVSIRDVGEVLRSNHALRTSEQRYRNLFERAPIMLCVCDRDEVIIAANDRWLQVLGYERSDVIGRNSLDFIGEESQSYVEKILYPRIWSAGRVTNEPLQFARKSGDLVDVLFSGVLETDEGGNPQVLVALDDVTEQKRLEHALLEEFQHGGTGRATTSTVSRSYGLTVRENTILKLLADGRADKEIATELDISPNTVSKHVASILVKMDVSSRTEASVHAVKEGLLP